MILSDDLYSEILLKPLERGADELLIVSGYATSAMAFRHMHDILGLRETFHVRLVVGMAVQEGIALSNHSGFKKLMNDDFRDKFECLYLTVPPAAHTKLYTWRRDSRPLTAFIGSANYTQVAFGTARREAMTSCDPASADAYCRYLAQSAVACNHPESEEVISILRDPMYRRSRIARPEDDITATHDFELEGLEHVDVSLLDRRGRLPTRSGLNWGQRPEYNREPNQGYIRLPATVYRTGFFPEPGEHFTVRTDDGKTFICARAQANGKAIECPHNNSIIGEYFRRRLGLQSGQLVSIEHLRSYGRTDVRFYKIDDETYYMHFSA